MAEKNELEQKVLNVLDQVRPYLQQDGGDLKFVGINDDMTVEVELCFFTELIAGWIYDNLLIGKQICFLKKVACNNGHSSPHAKCF